MYKSYVGIDVIKLCVIGFKTVCVKASGGGLGWAHGYLKSILNTTLTQCRRVTWEAGLFKTLRQRLQHQSKQEVKPSWMQILVVDLTLNCDFDPVWS